MSFCKWSGAAANTYEMPPTGSNYFFWIRLGRVLMDFLGWPSLELSRGAPTQQTFPILMETEGEESVKISPNFYCCHILCPPFEGINLFAPFSGVLQAVVKVGLFTVIFRFDRYAFGAFFSFIIRKPVSHEGPRGERTLTMAGLARCFRDYHP